MTKLFINVWPNRNLLYMEEFSEDYLNKLLTFTEVETTHTFDGDDAISLILLGAADKLKKYMNLHEIAGKVGLIENFSPNYLGWLLIVDAKNVNGSINPLVSKFFSWGRIESQEILSFEEFMSNTINS